jgi:lysophospholipase L1-like esterase
MEAGEPSLVFAYPNIRKIGGGEEGTVSQNIYLALGDSITTGYGVGANNSFAALFYKSLSTCSPGLKYVNLGVNGLKSADLAAMAEQTQVLSLIAQASVMSITIGSNDLLAIGKGLVLSKENNIALAQRNLDYNLMRLGNSIRRANSSAIIKVATIYKPTLPLNKQAIGLAQGLVMTANHSIRRMAREFRFRVIPVDKAFSGREQILLGADHVHPNLMGHSVISDLFIKY